MCIYIILPINNFEKIKNEEEQYAALLKELYDLLHQKDNSTNAITISPDNFPRIKEIMQSDTYKQMISSIEKGSNISYLDDGSSDKYWEEFA